MSDSQWVTDTLQSVSNKFDEYGLPPQHKESIMEYVANGRGVGHFLQATLSNDLCGAFSRADNTNKHCMAMWVMLLYNALPSGAWGSKDAFDQWIARGGLRGIDKNAA